VLPNVEPVTGQADRISERDTSPEGFLRWKAERKRDTPEQVARKRLDELARLEEQAVRVKQFHLEERSRPRLQCKRADELQDATEMFASQLVWSEGFGDAVVHAVDWDLMQDTPMIHLTGIDWDVGADPDRSASMTSDAKQLLKFGQRANSTAAPAATTGSERAAVE